MSEEDLLRTERLSKFFVDYRGGIFTRREIEVKAVNKVDLGIRKGSTHALVGESGSGKTTFSKTAIRIYEPTDGQIWFGKRNITRLNGKGLRALRKDMQMVFQDPTSSLNPRKSVVEIIGLPLKIHSDLDRNRRRGRVEELLTTVDLSPEYLERYPHSLSGGQKQRVGLARALATEPQLIALDEPTSALDVSVQAKILKLLDKLQKSENLTYLYVTHDLGIVRNISDFTSVMYLGKIVEAAPTENIFTSPKHPYTRALLSAIPVISESEKEFKPEEITLKGDVPSPTEVPPYCSFYSRCPKKMEKCRQDSPELRNLNDSQSVRCFLYY
ncbi:MAG: ABC transporter ATP-binding protein [Candidatus Acetothermia bacterium]